ncbi:MAG: CDP-alcohol phosphatidyltransferase family protein [Muricoprocola sp.]
MDTTKEIQKTSNKIITIPNILSFFRIALIPVLAWKYCIEKDSAGTVLLLLLSGFTDILDGFIARHFHMVSNLGKALDPVADKLTQGAMLACLMIRFPYMLWLLVLLAVKEIFSAVTGLLVIRRTGIVNGAKWHGKLTTCMIYGTVFLHLIWPGIPQGISKGLVIMSAVVMVVSCLLYSRERFQNLKDFSENR